MRRQSLVVKDMSRAWWHSGAHGETSRLFSSPGLRAGGASRLGLQMIIVLLFISFVAPLQAQSPLTDAVDLLRDAVEDDAIRGAVVLVAQHGKIVLHEAVGYRDKDKGLPMTRETVFHVASNTKPVIAAAVLLLAEEGKLGLDDEVGRSLPAFANEKCQGMTIRHLLNHTSGLRIPTLVLKPLSANPTLQTEVARFAAVGPEQKPGTTYSYNNPGYNTLGALIEVASKQPLERFLDERFYRPLGMMSTAHRDRPGLVERRAVITPRRDGVWRVTYRPGDAPELPFVRGSGGMLTTAADYAQFLQMFLNEGLHNGKRLLKPESVRLATSPQTQPLRSRTEPARETGTYGLGWFVDPEGVYSHGGSDGTFAWVDPRYGVVGILFTQSPGGAIPRREFVRLVRQATGVVSRTPPR